MNRKRSLDNPQRILNIPYAIYNTHKNARRQIQSQREQTQHTISYLQRQAKKSARQLESKQRSLLNYYHLKESRLKDQKIKEQSRERSEKELNMQRKINFSTREISALKKSIMKKDTQTLNKRRVQILKAYQSQSQRKLSQERQLERSLLRKKNSQLTQKIIVSNQHSRVRSRQVKIVVSSIVKNDLIDVQKNIKKRQQQTIDALKRRQQELLKTLEKHKKEHKKYDQSLDQMRSLPFEQFSNKLKSSQSQRSRKTSSRTDSYL